MLASSMQLVSLVIGPAASGLVVRARGQVVDDGRPDCLLHLGMLDTGRLAGGPGDEPGGGGQAAGGGARARLLQLRGA